MKPKAPTAVLDEKKPFRRKDAPKAPRVVPLNFRQPEDLDPQDRRYLAAAISIGVPEKDACNAVGLGFAAYKAWMSQPHPGQPDPYYDFRMEMLRAEGRGVVEHVKTLHDPLITEGMFAGDVGASRLRADTRRFLLRSRRPQHFGDAALAIAGYEGQQRLEGDQGGDPEAVVQMLSVLQLAGVELPIETLKLLGVETLPGAGQ